jgi:outer membrane protein TolC
MTLYDGGKTPANVRGAAADLARSQYELAESDQTSLGNLQLAYASLLDGKERVDLAAKQLAASQLQAQTTRDLYTLGLSAFQQWDQIENELIANEKSRIGSRRDAALALTEWERLLGREFKGVEP